MATEASNRRSALSLIVLAVVFRNKFGVNWVANAWSVCPQNCWLLVTFSHCFAKLGQMLDDILSGVYLGGYGVDYETSENLKAEIEGLS